MLGCHDESSTLSLLCGRPFTSSLYCFSVASALNKMITGVEVAVAVQAEEVVVEEVVVVATDGVVVCCGGGSLLEPIKDMTTAPRIETGDVREQSMIQKPPFCPYPNLTTH